MGHVIADDSIAVITWENPELALDSLDLPTRVGMQFAVVMDHEDAEEMLSSDHEIHTFRLRDEDGEVSYRGLVRNDGHGENQSILSDYGARDTGAWVIEVCLDGTWVMEIG